MPVSGPGYGLSSLRFREFSRNAAVERCVRRLLVLIHVERCYLEREKDVAEVELSYAGDRVGGVIHALPGEPA